MHESLAWAHLERCDTAATKFTANQARIMSIIYGCKDETKWYLVAGAGATTAYLGACTFSIPAMCIGTLVTSGGEAQAACRQSRLAGD